VSDEASVVGSSAAPAVATVVHFLYDLLLKVELLENVSTPPTFAESVDQAEGTASDAPAAEEAKAEGSTKFKSGDFEGAVEAYTRGIRLWRPGRHCVG
jgi:hypothetical protein